MGTLEYLVSAETSSNLQHHEKDCHVDVLGAVGMSQADVGHMAVFRLKYMHDRGSFNQAQAQFVYWTTRELHKRRIRLSGAKIHSLSVDTLFGWLNDACQSCDGLMYMRLAGSSELSSKHCIECNGTGVRRLNGDSDRTKVMYEVMCRADRAVIRVGSNIERKLGEPT